MRKRPTIDWTEFDAVLFDLDGVITPTADVHEKAWCQLFARWNCTAQDYLTFIDGKPRYDGVASFLASRGVELPWGDPTDPPGDETVCALGNQKNEYFNLVLATEGVTAYPGSIALLDYLDSLAMPAAIVSSSRNARAVLAAAGITDRFEAIVDGVTASTQLLPGKPAPDMFTAAAEILNVPGPRCVVVEDATAGVAAGAAGGFGYVLGVDRGDNRTALERAGATEVVDDLSETLPDHDGAS